MSKNRKLPVTLWVHWWKFIFRTALFVTSATAAAVLYFKYDRHLTEVLTGNPAVAWILWGIFAIEMLLKFFPSKLESRGCQKHLKSNYIKTGSTDIEIQDDHGAVLFGIIWIFGNGIFGALYLTGIIPADGLLLLSMLYGVGDMVCVLFFCPYQSWFLKNRCCVTCRVYNWDSILLFTPFIFIRNIYTWSLVAIAIVVLFHWEISFFVYPERFSEKTNAYLKCQNCTEKTCEYKPQLHSLWKHISIRNKKREERLKSE